MNTLYQEAALLVERHRRQPHLSGQAVIDLVGTDRQQTILDLLVKYREALVHTPHQNELDGLIEAFKVGIE